MKQQTTILIHIFFAIASACALFVCLNPLVNVSFTTLCIDCLSEGILLSSLVFFLNNSLKHGQFDSLDFKHQIIIYTATGVLFILIWLGIGFAILGVTITSSEYDELARTVPIRILICMLAYITSLLSVHKLNFVRIRDTDTDLYNESEPNEIKEYSSLENQNEMINETEDIEENIIEHIAVKNGQKIDIILIGDILHLQAEGDYVMIHSTKGRFLKEQTMKSFERTLPKNKFVRVHRSSIVNIDYIAQIELYDKQNQLLKLKNGTHVKVSLTGYKLLKKTLGL